MAEIIKEKNALKSYEDDMITYSIIVIRRRALPEWRDGFKPVQRRILYSMLNDSKAVSRFVKCAKIVGDTMGNYHPHGDSSIYGALVGMSTNYNTKVPLIEPEGNFGTIMGDPAAAMRYTEAKLSKFSMDCVMNELSVSKKITDWVATFDESQKEPSYIPVEVPLLLVEGSYGIAIGIMNEIPPHNLSEVLNITRKLLKDPTEKVILIPDHCMNCNIIDNDWETICNTGNGKYRVRGNVIIGEYKNEQAVIVTSLPDRVRSCNIMEKLNDMVLNKELPMVKDIIDLSGDGVVEVVIQLRKGSDAEFVREIIYKKTAAESSYIVNFEIIDDIESKRFSYKEYLLRFIEQQRITTFRLFCNKQKDVMTEFHKIDAYIKCIESGYIDEIITMIRKQKHNDDNGLIEFLIKKANITDVQAIFLINTPLKRLSEGYYNNYIARRDELLKQKEYNERYIFNSNNEIDELIDIKLADIDKKYGVKRTCKVIKASDDSNIPKGTFKIVVTENNYIRKISEGEKVISIKGDSPKFAVLVDNSENILLFDEKGRVFKLPVHKLPITDRTSPGIDIRMIIPTLTANIISVIYEPILNSVSKMKGKHFLTVVSANNYIKKMDIEDFLTVPLSGIIYTKISPDDSIKSVEIIANALDLIVYSGNKALRMSMNEVSHYKRSSQGVFAMNTTKHINGLSVIYPNSTHIIVISNNGNINKFDITGLERSSRYKSGSSVIKLGKSDSIFSIYGVNDSNTLRVITRLGTTDILVKDIPVMSSVSAGSRMIPLKSDNIIKTIVG